MKSKIADSWVEDGRRSRPIPDPAVIEFIDKKITSQYLYSETVLPNFINEYFKWIQSSRLNTLHGLEKFNQLDFMHARISIFA